MPQQVIAFSLKNRPLIVLAALAVLLHGTYTLRELPVDVLPDLNRPTVTIMTEAPGLAPEEVEILVTRPLEFLLNGATGVQRVRSSSAVGLSIVWVEFDWGSDIYRDRQIVAEKLQLARDRLPPGVNPVLAPISSIMGEIMLLGLRQTTTTKEPAGGVASASSGVTSAPSRVASAPRAIQPAMELRTLGEFNVRNRLLAIPGVAQVTVMGGILKQYQVLTTPARLAAHDVTLEQLVEAAQKANVLAGGGVLVRTPTESVIRLSGQSLKLEQIENTPVVWRAPRPVLIKDVAEVRFGGPIARGAGSLQVRESGTVSGGTAVILAVQKQPGADTLLLDRTIDQVLAELRQELPAGVVIEDKLFRQADFIRTAVDNVSEAVREAAVWVVVVLFLFMANLRVSVSSLVAMPLSLLLTFLVFRWWGVSLNTMTLGGIAVAIGDLVDDSIVDIENIFRRLRENRQLPQPRPPLRVVYDASCEVRGSIVYATLIVTLVVLPLFTLGGIEGRIFAPLGLAYVVALLCSLLVSLTITPVLGSYLLPTAPAVAEKKDPFLLALLKRWTERLLRFTLKRAKVILIVVLMLAGLSMLTLFWMGSEFLPPFNEGTLTVTVRLEPGVSLEESERVARRVERLLLEVPEVLSLARRTGRAELDEHAEGVNSSEIDIRLQEHHRPKDGWFFAVLRWIPIAHLWGYETVGRSREEVAADIRERLSIVPGIVANIGQPISHRLDHLLTGVRAQVTVKVFGQDLQVLRHTAYDVRDRLSRIPGVVDLQVEPQVEVPQLRLRVNRQEAARHGLAPGDVTRLLETAYRGRVLSQVLEEDRWFDLVVWFDESARNHPSTIAQTILDTPSGRKVTLGQVAEVLETTGPNTLQRENVQRRLAVFCNVQGRDLGSVVADIRQGLVEVEERLRAQGGNYRLELGGQFQAQQAARWRLLFFGGLTVVGVFLLLWRCLGSWRSAVQVMVNVPLAALGAVIALLIVNRPSWEQLLAAPWWQWPRVWVSATTLSLAHWVGFITLIGIVSRNGILMISHYQHLMEQEGEAFGEQMIIRGSLERLAPVLMTACTSFIGLLPLLTGAGQTGKEILHPLAVVVFGGMISSTLLDQIVTPALFFKFGRPRPAPANQPALQG